MVPGRWHRFALVQLGYPWSRVGRSWRQQNTLKTRWVISLPGSSQIRACNQNQIT